MSCVERDPTHRAMNRAAIVAHPSQTPTELCAQDVSGSERHGIRKSMRSSTDWPKHFLFARSLCREPPLVGLFGDARVDISTVTDRPRGNVHGGSGTSGASPAMKGRPFERAHSAPPIGRNAFVMQASVFV